MNNRAIKDYYEILGISRDANPGEIKRVYRKLALEHHPDRNPGDPGAEEKFKALNEAYGVLGDPEKRRLYDQTLDGIGARDTRFTYSQEEILKDLFNNPSFAQMFTDLKREFEKTGVRFDESYINRVFFEGRGFFMAGVFFIGPFGRSFPGKGFPARREISLWEEAGKLVGRGIRKLAHVGKRAADYLVSRAEESPRELPRSPEKTVVLPISTESAKRGAKIQVQVEVAGKPKRFRVTVPAGVKEGTRLRLKDALGAPGQDLFLVVEIS